MGVDTRLSIRRMASSHQTRFSVRDRFGLSVLFGRLEETHFRNGVVKQLESKPRGLRKKKSI